MAFIVFLALALAIAYRATTAQERERIFRSMRDGVRAGARAARKQYEQVEPFHATLRARTPFAPVTPLIVALNLIAFVAMAFDSRAIADPEALIAWGGNFGPDTANGEWWRLWTALFLHSSAFHLMVNLIGLVPAGLILERLVGPIAFALIYFAAGMFASLFNLAVAPMVVMTGASASIAGIYGLMVAALLWRFSHREALAIPWIAIKYVAGSIALFATYTVAAGESGAASIGITAGLLLGLVVARGVHEGRAPAQHVAATVAATLVIAVSAAVPLRGITDARPQLAAIVELEERTSAAFRERLQEFTAGRIRARTLAEFIDGEIVPDLADARAKLDSLDGVPPEQQPPVAAADEFLRLRDYSWRIRSEAFRQGRMAILRDADASQTAALQALERVKSPTAH